MLPKEHYGSAERLANLVFGTGRPDVNVGAQ
jgi:hypothetical protein